MNEYKKIADALAICMPETHEESEHDCVECPYFNVCKDDEVIALPSSLVIAIRTYFSRNKTYNVPVQ